MNLKKKLLRQAKIPFICASLVGMCGANAQTTAIASEAPASELNKVTVVGEQTSDSRRYSSVGKITVTSDELQKYNDSSLIEALKRIQGISVGSGKSGEIRLRGMGNGYTQILINGEPAGKDFSLDSLSPELIEKVEIQKSASADQSIQSIAGTINLVTKRKNSNAKSGIKASVDKSYGEPTGRASINYGNKMEDLSYSLVGTLSVTKNTWPSVVSTTSTGIAPSDVFGRTNDVDEVNRTVTIGLAPSATWNFGDENAFSVSGLLQLLKFDFVIRNSRKDLYGPAPSFASDIVASENDINRGRVTVDWKQRLGQSGNIDLKSLGTVSTKAGSIMTTGYDENKSELLLRDVKSSEHNVSLSTKGKYSLEIGNGHELALGVDGGISSRREVRKQVETSSVGYPILNLNDDYTADIARLALFVQDEIEYSKSISAYFGLRFESLTTVVSGVELEGIRNSSSVASPIFQLLWKIPNTKSDQLRLALAKTYKAPTAAELTPRKWISEDNTASTPNSQGNPNLLPELAWGIDVGYEKYFLGDGFVGVNGFARHISNVVLKQLWQQNGVWISSPFNSGTAEVFGIEVEAKGKAKAFFSDAPDIEFRSGFTRNVSRVNSVQGPDNRIREQRPFTANFGFDFTPKSSALTLGSNFTFGEKVFAQSTQTGWQYQSTSRNLDIYSKWKMSKKSSMQIALLNVLREDVLEVNGYSDGSLYQYANSVSKNPMTVRLSVDLALP